MTQNSSVSSGPIDADTKLTIGADYLKGVLVGAAANVLIYDGEDNTGKLIFEYDNTTGTLPAFCDFSHMVQSKGGMFVAVTGGTVYIYHK